MQAKQVTYYDWSDFHAAILTNLNKLLVETDIEPIKDLHGGRFKDGKWLNSIVLTVQAHMTTISRLSLMRYGNIATKE